MLDIITRVVVGIGIASAIWFLLLWPLRLNKRLRKSNPGARPFFFGYFLSSLFFYGSFWAMLGILHSTIVEIFSSVYLFGFGVMILLIVGAVFGFFGYVLKRRLRFGVVGFLGLSWLATALFTYYLAGLPESHPSFFVFIYVYVLAFLAPFTLYCKRRWYEFELFEY